jgi:hypothetical protein
VCPTNEFHTNVHSKSLILLMGANGILSPFSTVFCPVWIFFSKADANKNLLNSNFCKNWCSDNHTYNTVHMNIYPYFLHLMVNLGDIQYDRSAHNGVQSIQYNSSTHNGVQSIQYDSSTHNGVQSFWVFKEINVGKAILYLQA